MTADLLAPGRIDLRDRLRTVLNPDEITWQDDALEAAAVDRSGLRLPGRPLALVTPGSVDGVRAVMRLAHAAGADRKSVV